MAIRMFAAVTDLARPGTKTEPVGLPASPVLGDLVLVLLIGSVFTLFLALLVYVRHRQKRRRRVAHALPAARRSEAKPARDATSRRSRRNPTLAETGGLPPVRDQQPSPPAA